MRPSFVLLSALAFGTCVGAVAAAEDRVTGRQAADGNGRVEIVQRSRTTGLATFIRGHETAPVGLAVPSAATGHAAPDAFVRQYGPLFGVGDAATELRSLRTTSDALGHAHTSYQQVHRNIPVFSGVLKVHQNAHGDFLAANGRFYLGARKVNTVATLSENEAIAAGAAWINARDYVVEHSELVIVDPGWYGDAPIGPHLAYYVVLNDPGTFVRQALFIDAHDGAVLDEWSLVLTARMREVYDGLDGAALPGLLVRSEGDPPVGSPADVDRAYDYAGDVYDYFYRAFTRDSIDDAGMTLILTVNSTYPPCPNAQWNGSQMIFCSGTVTDDITAHEMGHGITDATANLIYQNQSGQLNESYSDIWGELVDLFNGNAAFPGSPGGSPAWPGHPTGPGVDTPNNLRSACSYSPNYDDGVRWLVGEDATAFGGAIRDMWSPACAGDPDRANSPLQTCPEADNGGVHSGSGVPNHAFAILTDGKTFNGYTVSAVGPIKAAAVWYRALTVYLTPASDFKDAYVALNQAAADLVGSTPQDPRSGLASATPFSAADAVQVDNALLAVEMNTDGACGATVDILDPIPPARCTPRITVYADAFETGPNGWTVSTTGSPDTAYEWQQVSALPFGRGGTAWFCMNLDDGCPPGGDESAVRRLVSPSLPMPISLSDPTLAFTHYVATEPGYDGANLKISVNGGAWQLIPASAFTYNPYNATIIGSSTNPLAGQAAWSGAGGQWGTSLVDLSAYVSGGESIRLRFELGQDYCYGIDGWYVDDFEVYSCATCSVDADCDDGAPCTNDACVAGSCVNSPVAGGTPCPDGLFCNGEETCQGGVCTDQADPCVDQAHCDEVDDVCLECVDAADCADGNPCTLDACTAGACASTNAPDGTACPDAAFCNGEETCQGGVCTDQADPCVDQVHCDEAGGVCLVCVSDGECDDGDPCTHDSCDPLVGCANVPSADPETDCCDPANGDLTPIDDGNACTQDVCNPDGTVDHSDMTPAGQCCDPATGGLTPIDDGNACTQDVCNPDGTVDHSDMTPAGQCCDPATGDLTPIDDGNACTQDVCNPDGTVEHNDVCLEPPAPEQDAVPKHRYISFRPRNPGRDVAFRVVLAASSEYPASAGMLGWASAPFDPSCQTGPGASPTPPCDAVDYLVRIVATPVFFNWTQDLVHLGDCAIVPVATYEISATLDGVVFSNALEIPTIRQPGSRHFGDVVGEGTGQLPPAAGFTPPNRVVNVSDIQAFILTVQGASSPSAHVAWVDLHGLGPGSPPNFILNVSDLQQIKFGFQGQLYVDSPEHMNPADCPP
ncbi:MAG: M4 family metallopeptidase [Phycisphaerae bacterium]